MEYRPTVLIIRDGWGENHNPDHDKYNAVKLANTPVADRIRDTLPRTEIMACGRDVGLPDGVMGNSEVGHQNIGAGRIVDQELVRIDKAFESGAAATNPVLSTAIDKAKAGGGRMHLMGLVSDAGVHAMLEHLYGILRIAKEAGLSGDAVAIHAFMDGRDTSPNSGLGYIKALEEQCAAIGVGKIVSLCGRFWAMDRDKRWERVELAYNLLTGKSAKHVAPTAADAVQHYYHNPLSASQKGDEFLAPSWVNPDGDSAPTGTITDGDSVVFFNYRGDRPRELTRAFIDDDFDGFARDRKLNLYYATMTAYEKGLCPNVLFPKPPKMVNILGGYVADRGIRQFRCAETEKYPHVTFFFNDYRDEPFDGEDQKIIPSPKEVSTYDQKPEMSAEGVCAASDEAIRSGDYGLIVVNFANPDMVGHTGNLDAVKTACETVDACVGRLVEAIDAVGGAALITADHGNADQMFDPSVEGPHTSHTLNPVEVVIVGKGCEDLKLKQSGRLADIAPTLLKLMGLPQPAEMTGTCLIDG